MKSSIKSVRGFWFWFLVLFPLFIALFLLWTANSVLAFEVLCLYLVGWVIRTGLCLLRLGNSRARKGSSISHCLIGSVIVVAIALFALLSVGSNPGSLLGEAATFGHLWLVKSILACDVDPDLTSSHFPHTPLLRAAFQGNRNVVKVLLDYGADPNARWEKDGMTALMFAAGHGSIEMAKDLLDKGVEVNAKSRDGDTALIMAAGHGDTEMVKLLLAEGADVAAQTNYGLTALDLAKKRGYRQVATILELAH